jgi:dihydroorotate dehydrogenase (NAD+) catalytic subunit
MGGISTGEDALEFLAAGAAGVALGTVLFADPEAPRRVRRELDEQLRARGIASPAQATGIAHEARTSRTPVVAA